MNRNHLKLLHPSARETVMADQTELENIKLVASAVGNCTTFAELTAVALVNQFLRKGRRSDARRLLTSYLKKHGPTPRIAALLRVSG